MDKRAIVELISRVLPVRIVCERPEGVGDVLKSSSPWAVTTMTPSGFYLDENATDEELFHELGHCVAWVKAGRPPGVDWGFTIYENRRLAAYDSGVQNREGEWEINACAVGVFCELRQGRITFAQAVTRMMDEYNFDQYQENSNLSREEWTRRQIENGENLLAEFIEGV